LSPAGKWLKLGEGFRADFLRRDLWTRMGSESFPVRGVSGSRTAEAALEDLLRVLRLLGLSKSTAREVDSGKDALISPKGPGGGVRTST